MILVPPGSAWGTGPARTYATWNPANKGANITLSGGNLIGTQSGAGVDTMVQSTTSKSSGKWYWETAVTQLATTMGFFSIGITSVAAVTGRSVGDNAGDYGYQPLNGAVRNGGSTLAFVATAALNDIIGFALDLTDNYLYIYKNGTLIRTQAIAAGTYYAAASTNFGVNDRVAANFNAARTIQYSQPAGFNPGLYT